MAALAGSFGCVGRGAPVDQRSGLSPHKRIDENLREDLVTLSAARDRKEAEELKTLLATPVDAEPVMFTSRTLWADLGPRDQPALPPFVRYLLLRALAARPQTHPRGWYPVFALLCDRAGKNDLSGRLHHTLALGDVGTVAEELAALLPEQSGRDWLVLLDNTVSTPDPRQPSSDAGTGRPPEVPHSPLAPITRLINQLHALGDPRLSDRDTLRHSYLLIAHDYHRIADVSPDGLTLFIDRAQRYRRLAEALA
jgi:hypothetical protein